MHGTVVSIFEGIFVRKRCGAAVTKISLASIDNRNMGAGAMNVNL